MATYSNVVLFNNSVGIDTKIRLVKSKKKEAAINASDQIPDGGFIVIVDYPGTRYVKITDGVKTISEIPKDGEGGGGSSDASTLNGQPGTYYRNRANHTGTQGINTISGLQSALNDKADSSSLGTAATADVGDFATAAQGALADTAVQPAALSSYVPTTRTVNGQALTANISLTNTDVGAAATSHTHPSTQISDSTATGRSVLTAASAAAARTAIGAGTSNLALGTTGSTALAGNTPVVKSQQESGVGTLISNIIQVTQTQYDGLTPQAGTFYAIVG